MCTLIKAANIERLMVPAVRGNATHNSPEEMLEKRNSIDIKHYSNFWLCPTQSEIYSDHDFTYTELREPIDKFLGKGHASEAFNNMIEDAQFAKAQKEANTFQ